MVWPAVVGPGADGVSRRWQQSAVADCPGALPRLREAMPLRNAIAGVDLRREPEVAAATDLSGVRVGCRARQMLG